MPAQSREVALDFAFFTHLWDFYVAHRGLARRHYKELTKKFLDFNDPENSHAFLRRPQFEALELYVFLKEFLDNAPLQAVFRQWADREGPFVDRSAAARAGASQLQMFEELTKGDYDAIFDRLRAGARAYPNYIFALTMGTGKTILMAVCIFYEFLLANKFPQDPRYCHNALVFAPDTTVLQSLREIQTLDMALVVPPEYVSFLNANIKYHFLEDTGVALSTIDASRFNVIISNTQKVILKRQAQEPSLMDRLFKSGKPTYTPGTVYAEFSDLYDDEPEDESDLTTNQRFEKLRRLEQLGIYVDEAHHAFGAQLARDMGLKQSKTSLRLTIDELAASLKRAGTRVVACYNYTGTPYVGKEVLPEVVYAFNLQDAIRERYLKRVRINGYTNPRTTEFVGLVVDDFVAAHAEDARYEGLKPKLAFFAATIEELQKELRPAVETALRQHGIPLEHILVNVGDEKLTSNDDIREFNRLDTPGSEKQFILLVNKGREGWNCRSLFGVALFRQPKSKIFVLQATMRCLRSITEAQQTGRVYLSAENIAILEAELQQNFRVTVTDVIDAGKHGTPQRIAIRQPVERVKLTRVRRTYTLTEKPLTPGNSLGLAEVDTEPYQLIHTEYEGLIGAQKYRSARAEDLTYLREQRTFSPLTLVAEIARYLNQPCLEVECFLAQTAEGVEGILEHVNRYNDMLYDHVIPRLFNALYTITEQEETEDYEVDLVKVPPEGHYSVTAVKDMVVHQSEATLVEAARSFHLDPYCFDSNPERVLFWALLRDGRVDKVYFTGMLTHGQSDFYIQYIDPDSHTVRSYYPDFLVQKADGSYVIVEVKGDNRIEDHVVQAKKEFAEQMAVASGMTYGIVKGSDAVKGRYEGVVGEEVQGRM